MLIGMRIPRKFFVTKGTGESDITIHAGSYHLALKMAGIETYNIMQYSSILPEVAVQVSRPNHGAPHGSVMETISAVAHAFKGDLASAGICFGWLYGRNLNEKYGGLVCEYGGHIAETYVEKILRDSIQEIYMNGFSEKYVLRDLQLITTSIIPNKQHGTALVALCFLDYEVPILKED